jgi:signal transduction histidine kinase
MIRPRANKSLAFRLYMISAIWGIIALVVVSIVLTTLFRGSVERNFDRQVVNSLRELTRLLAERAADPETIETIELIGLADPQYRTPVSGWYWQILKQSDQEILAESDSLFGDTLPDLPPPTFDTDPQGLDRRNAPGLDGERLRVLRQDIEIGDTTYRLIATGNLDTVEDDVSSFRNLVVVTLGIFGLGLVMASYLMVRFGLRPLEQIRRSLSAIRSGKQKQLTGSFPSEISPLVDEVNALLQSNQAILERARTQVGNLAHGLKTPLSVLTNEAETRQGPGWSTVGEHAELMKGQVETYLARAQMAARSSTVADSVSVLTVIEPLLRTMRRLYPNIDIDVDNQCTEQTRFRGERHDLEEILGNLIDNACKYANSAVTVQAMETADGDRPGFSVIIADDGPGLEENEIAMVMKRGKRLDEQKPGSGLGLSIVDELVQIYAGQLKITTGPAGGLVCQLQLPTTA